MSQLLLVFCLICLTGTALGAAIKPTTTTANSNYYNNNKEFRSLHLRIAQCRQRCYRQTLPPPLPLPTEAATPALCRAASDCYMCHDYCRSLAIAEWSLGSSMCADLLFCSHGCRIACEFHRLRSGADAAVDADANALLKTVEEVEVDLA